MNTPADPAPAPPSAAPSAAPSAPPSAAPPSAAAAPVPAARRYPRLYQPEGGYLFLVTWGRSGSTLLQNLLNSIDGYCIRGENNNVLADLARAWVAVAEAEPMRGRRQSGQPSGPDHPWYGAELVAPEKLGLALANVFARDVLNLPPGTRVGGFKEIRYHLAQPEPMKLIRFMAEFFPKARFLVNTRSHAATMKSGWWATMPPETVERQLRGAEALFDRIAREFPDRTLRLHYEDYVGQPEALRPLHDFLGEPFDAARVAAVMDNRLTHSGLRSRRPER